MKRFTLLMALLVLALCLSGCWDSREITEIDVVSCIWIDKGDEPGTIKMGAQISQGKSTESSNGVALSNIANIDYNLEGENVFECIKQLEIESTYSLYMQHNQAIIIGSSLAEEGLSEHLDFFLREHQSRMDVWLYIAEGKAEDVIGANIKQEDSVAIALSNLMYKQDNVSSYWGVKLLDYYKSLMQEAKAVMVPVVSVIPEGEHDTYSIKNMAVLQGDRMIGMFDNDEVQGVNWLLGNVREGRLSSNTSHGKTTFKTSTERSRIVPRFESEKNVTLDIYIITDIFTLDVFSQKNVGVSDIDAILSLDAKNEINRLAENSLKKAQSLSADVYGFGYYLYTRHPRQWDAIKDDWPEIFKNMKVNIIIDIKMPYNLKLNTPIDIEEILDYGKTT